MLGVGEVEEIRRKRGKGDMRVGEATELVVIQKAMSAFRVAKFLEGVLEPVELVVVEETDELWVEAGHNVVTDHDVEELRGSGAVWETQDLVAVLVAAVGADREANDNSQSCSVLVMVCDSLVRMNPVERCREPGYEPRNIWLDPGRVLELCDVHT